MLRLYDNRISGNGYKVRLLLTQLALPFERVELDLFRGETRRPAFLALNPNGRIPLLRLEDGRHLAESNAILCYLADGTPFWPAERGERAEMLQWLFFEQYSHEPYIAVRRSFFVGGRYGLADIALYAYTHVAEEGGFDLAGYPAIKDWLARVKGQPNHIAIDAAVGAIPADAA